MIAIRLLDTRPFFPGQPVGREPRFSLASLETSLWRLNALHCQLDQVCQHCWGLGYCRAAQMARIAGGTRATGIMRICSGLGWTGVGRTVCVLPAPLAPLVQQPDFEITRYSIPTATWTNRRPISTTSRPNSSFLFYGIRMVLKGFGCGPMLGRETVQDELLRRATFPHHQFLHHSDQMKYFLVRWNGYANWSNTWELWSHFFSNICRTLETGEKVDLKRAIHGTNL